MKVLLDHSIDWRLKRFLPSHDVKSAQEMGWDQLQNGKLLAEAASATFDVVLTVDRNLKSEQNLVALPIAVIVLIARSNRTEDLSPMMATLESALLSLKSGQLVEIESNGTISVVAPGR